MKPLLLRLVLPPYKPSSKIIICLFLSFFLQNVSFFSRALNDSRRILVMEKPLSLLVTTLTSPKYVKSASRHYFHGFVHTLLFHCLFVCLFACLLVDS